MEDINNADIDVTYEDGVLRPDQALELPDWTRLRISIRRIEPTPEAEARARRKLNEIRDSGAIRLGGWRPRRDELHESAGSPTGTRC